MKELWDEDQIGWGQPQAGGGLPAMALQKAMNDMSKRMAETIDREILSLTKKGEAVKMKATLKGVTVKGIGQGSSEVRLALAVAMTTPAAMDIYEELEPMTDMAVDLYIDPVQKKLPGVE